MASTAAILLPPDLESRQSTVEVVAVNVAILLPPDLESRQSRSL